MIIEQLLLKNMERNRVYAGSPAKDVTEKMGPQFKENISLEQKERVFAEYLEEYKREGGNTEWIMTCRSLPLNPDPDHTWFNIATRQYTPVYSDDEHRFFRFLLYDRAKFIPVASAPTD